MSFDQFSYRRFFPWLRLVEAIGIALSLRQLLVAAAATGVLMLTGMLSHSIVHGNPTVVFGGWSVGFSAELSSAADISIHRQMNHEFLRPWMDLLQCALGIFSPRAHIQERLLKMGFGLWLLAVWSLFGLILCRLAARRFTRHEDGSFRKSVQFGFSRCQHGILAPLLPVLAALIMLICAVVVALPGRAPMIGATLGMLVAPLLVVCSLAAAYLVFAVLLGWPLMVAAIATDDCDGFGAFSRSYSFWTGRAWYFAWCWIVACFVGFIAMSLAYWLGFGTLYFSNLAISSGIGPSLAAESTEHAAMAIVAFLMRTFAISLFWSLATIVYILLRQSVDKMPLDHSAPDDDERGTPDPLPVVGMPAMR